MLWQLGATQVEALAAIQAANALVFTYLADVTRVGEPTDTTSSQQSST